jgi:hypothetical protein
MTKKHFIALADVNALADFCHSQNPNFNRSRWMGYIAGECGPNGKVAS